MFEQNTADAIADIFGTGRWNDIRSEHEAQEHIERYHLQPQRRDDDRAQILNFD